MSQIVTINAGSSSLKARVYQIDETGAKFGREPFEVKSGDLIEESKNFLDQIRQNLIDENVIAIVHRIVHGGPSYSSANKISDSVEADLKQLADFDPDHAPFALALIKASKDVFGNVDQYACFDTAFFHDLPDIAKLLPLPRNFMQEGLRRYGFHGLSYSYLQQSFEKIAGKDASNGRVIYAHLGSGSSLAATLDGKPVDTTMAFTPASGVVMSSRSGDLDPGIIWYLNRKYNVTPEEFNDLVNTQSGLLGVSDVSADMKTLIDMEHENKYAAEAVELYCYRVAQAIGSLTTSIGGLDSIIFSGGIGEQSSILRKRICDRLGFLGVSIDNESNQKHESLISGRDSKVGVHVISTDEASVMVDQVLELINKDVGQNGQQS